MVTGDEGPARCRRGPGSVGGGRWGPGSAGGGRWVGPLRYRRTEPPPTSALPEA